MEKLKIYNAFGITPTNNCLSAGMDFYIPNIDRDNKEMVDAAFEAFEKTYKANSNVINVLVMYFAQMVEKENLEREFVNICQLYLALDSATLNEEEDLYGRVKRFVKEYLVFDKAGRPGILMKCNDSLLINSGIKVALAPGTAGVFLNKSGKGNCGFDVRAQVVDEDYTGYVHLSVSYSKKNPLNGQNAIYAGDKLIQMLVLDVYHVEPTEVSKDEYDEMMKNSERGDTAFGNSDIKH